MRRKNNALKKAAAFLALPIPDVELLVDGMANPDSGIRFVLGIKKLAKGARKGISEVQSVIFDKLKWTADAASQWLKDHEFITSGKDEGATFWRFRQKEPKGYKTFRTVIPGMNRNPGALHGFRLYNHRDQRYHGGIFGTWDEAVNYGLHIGLSPGEYEVQPAAVVVYGRPRPSDLTHGGQSKARVNPAETIPESLSGHLALTSDPAFRSQPPEIQAAMMTGMDFAEKLKNPAYGQVKGRDWQQEWYETASGDARKRARELRKLGYWIGVSKGTPQVTPAGVVNMTLVSIGPGTTKDEYLENVPTTTLVRLNPEPAAAELYEQFHGKPPGETLEIVTEKHEHEWLVQLGGLVELKLATVSGLDASIRFSGKDAPQLCSSEDGRQLYIEGGDQELDLEKLRMAGKKWLKDSMVIGVLGEVTYQAQKGFQKFKLTDYYHKMGEESGVQPHLLYSPHDKLLSVSGGQYEVRPEGIVN